MSEQAANTQPSLTLMEFVPASHFLRADEAIAISGFGVDLPEAAETPQPDSDIDRLPHGCATVSIDVYGEGSNDRVEIRDVSNTPWIDEETDEQGNFLVTRYAPGAHGRLEIQDVYRLRPGEAIGLRDSSVPETSPADLEQRTPESSPLSIEISPDGQLQIANHSPTHVVRVRNLGQTGKLMQRPLVSPAPESTAQPAATADTETAQPEEHTEASLPKRVRRRRSAIGALGVGSQAQADITADAPPSEHQGQPRHALRETDRADQEQNRLGRWNFKPTRVITVPPSLLPKPEEN